MPGEQEYQDKNSGLSMSDVLELPDTSRTVLNWILRQGTVSLNQVMSSSPYNEEETRQVLAALIEKGFVREINLNTEAHYQARLVTRRKPKKPAASIWDSFDK